VDWQLALAAVLVAAAVAYLARRAWRTLARRGGCGGCGAAPPAKEGERTIIPAEQVKLLRRE
jgi:hypothetical protein